MELEQERCLYDTVISEKRITARIDKIVWHNLYCFQTWFLFSYNLLNDFLSNSDNIASNERMKIEWWIVKDVEGSGRGLM
jgi:hypothetical protein